ncbi:MAG: orotate phosphoribosyltransferase, partial [Bacteroidia bacterium]
GSRTVLIEDLISTGSSSLQAAETLRQAGVEVLGVLSVFTYGFPVASRRFEEAGFRLLSLCSYPELLESAVENFYLSAEELNSLNAWRNQPETWEPESANS